MVKQRVGQRPADALVEQDEHGGRALTLVREAVTGDQAQGSHGIVTACDGIETHAHNAVSKAKRQSLTAESC
jgi:hypothetical protein